MSKNSKSLENGEIIGRADKIGLIVGYILSFILIFIQVMTFKAQEFTSITSLLALLGLFICFHILDKKKKNSKIRFHFKLIQAFFVIWIIIFLIRLVYLRFVYT